MVAMNPSVGSLEFRFNAGRLCLDLPATVRRRASAPHDVLAVPGGAARWLEEAGLVERPLRLSPARAAELLRLREAIWAAARALVKRRKLPSSAVQVINRAAAHPAAVPRLDARALRRSFVARDAFRSALSSIARDAIELLSSDAAQRIKVCAQADCRMLFLDGSPAGRRRWCSMNRCGSRSKGRTFRLAQRLEERRPQGATHGLARVTRAAPGGRRHASR